MSLRYHYVKNSRKFLKIEGLSQEKLTSLANVANNAITKIEDDKN